jgi:hypothetical protein
MAANNLVNNGVCVTTKPAIAPLRLTSDFRDYPGRQHEKFCELVDPIIELACFQPRIFHAPATNEEAVGAPANGFLEYVLELPAGGFLLGFLHTTLSGLDGIDPGFRLQITDVARNYRLFGKPASEKWFLNDILSTDGGAGLALDWVLNPAPRLLPAPYPIAPPGQFKLEFWNTLASTNKGLQMSFIVACPPEGQLSGQ